MSKAEAVMISLRVHAQNNKEEIGDIRLWPIFLCNTHESASVELFFFFTHRKLREACATPLSLAGITGLASVPVVRNR